MSRFIKYYAGYKYQLAIDYFVVVSIRPPADISHDFIMLTTAGELHIRAGYAWDGPSGPTIDTSNFMRGSLVHDALYQLMREGLLSETDREQADLELRRICQEDGMSRLRAWWVYRAVRGFGSAAAAVQPDKILIAP